MTFQKILHGFSLYLPGAPPPWGVCLAGLPQCSTATLGTFRLSPPRMGPHTLVWPQTMLSIAPASAGKGLLHHKNPRALQITAFCPESRVLVLASTACLRPNHVGKQSRVQKWWAVWGNKALPSRQCLMGLIFSFHVSY